MDNQGRHFVSRRIIAYEIFAFAGIIVFIWFDEVLDIPYLFFGAAQTPINWTESMFESMFIAILGGVIINFTKKMFQRMKYLEGILPVCASCKKIRDDGGQWHEIESYIHNRSAAKFSHGICPECRKKLYPELFTD